MYAVLFDLDGTLLSGSGPRHLRAMAAALKEVAGLSDPFTTTDGSLEVRGTPLSGLIDAQILRLALGDTTRHHLIPTLVAETCRHYDQLVSRYGTGATVLPGVRETLSELGERGVACALVTGNAEQIARRKLDEHHLENLLPTGAYGASANDRSELFEVVLGQLSRQSGGRRPDKTIYVGDTPLDVAAARRRGGIVAVAVATGAFGRAHLEAVGPAAVIDDLRCGADALIELAT